MTEDLRILVADDEPLVREGVIEAIRRTGSGYVVEARDGIEALAHLQEHAIDIAFLDIRMPGLDGFELLSRVAPGHMPVVVFITAYDEYALRAFQARAIDYVLKPIDDERIAAAMERARRFLQGAERADLEERLREIIANMARPAGAGDRIAVRLGATDVLLAVDDIDYIEGDRNYVRLHADGRAFPVRATMAALEDRLSDRGFVRIHRSTIVNLQRVREIRRDTRGRSFAVLADGTRLRVSDTGRDRLARLVPPPG